MKKLFFIAAIAGAALVSCTKNELAPSATEQHEINFASPVTNVVTKANNLMPSIYSPDERFAVFADHHFLAYNDKNVTFSSYMRGTNDEGVVVAYSASDPDLTINAETYDFYWKPTKKYYWPTDGYLSFAAYSPSSISADYDIKYTPEHGVEFVYSTPNIGSQFDLMLSDRATNQKRTSMKTDWEEGNGEEGEYDGVNIKFRHVLSAISFIVKTYYNYGTDGYGIELNSLTVKDAYSEGKLVQFADEFGTEVKLDDVWTIDETKTKDHTVSTGNATLTSKNGASAQVISWATNGQADLILLPQALDHNGETAGGEVYVEIKYTVYHDDMPAEGITYTHNLPLAHGTIAEWAPSTRYLYTIIIGMEEIVFAPTIVTDWDTPSDEDIDNNEDINL